MTSGSRIIQREPAISERNRTAVFSVRVTSDRRFGWIPAAAANAGEDFRQVYTIIRRGSPAYPQFLAEPKPF
jgi:hypothetical protein